MYRVLSPCRDGSIIDAHIFAAVRAMLSLDHKSDPVMTLVCLDRTVVRPGSTLSLVHNLRPIATAIE